MVDDSMHDMLMERRKIGYRDTIISECMILVKNLISESVNEDNHIMYPKEDLPISAK